MEAPHRDTIRSMDFWFSTGHDARLDGHRDARDAGPLQEAEEVLVIKEELTHQMLGAGVHLLLEVAQVAYRVGALRVPLRVTGGGHTEVPPPADEGHQFVGVEELRLWGIVRVPVPPQGQHVLYAVCLQVIEQLGHLPLGGGDAGQVGHGGDVVLLLDDGRDLPGGLVHLGAHRLRR